jgi:hypothetical protein
MNSIQKRFSYNKLTNNNENLLLQTQSKNALSLYIEIPLYFSQIPGLSLPLIASFLSKFEISFEMRSLDELTIKNSLTSLSYKNKVNMTMIYSVIYLDDFERELFSTKRHEYLYERKIYNNSIQLDITNTQQKKVHVPFNSPIKDFYYYTQLQSMLNANQYYNFTFDFLLPELNMSSRNKIIYLQQVIDNNQYDSDIYNIYSKLLTRMNQKIQKINIKMQRYSSNNQPFSSMVNLNNLQFLYNNLTNDDQIYAEELFENYFIIKQQTRTIYSSNLYLNGVQRYSISDDISNKIIPYQSYNNMIPGLQTYNFALHPLEYQPSGNANFFALKPEMQYVLDKSIENLNKNDVLIGYCFARSYNIMRFISGIGGMAW